MDSATYYFWDRCVAACARNASKEEIEELLDEARGYQEELYRFNLDYVLDEPSIKNLRTLCGWLANYMDIRYGGSITKIENNSSSSSTVSNNININLDLINDIDNSGLSQEENAKLKLLMLELATAKEKDPKSVASKLKDALDIAKSSTGAAKTLLDFVIPVIQSIS